MLKYIIAIGTLSFALPCLAAPYSATAGPSADAFVKSVDATHNFGSDGGMGVSGSTAVNGSGTQKGTLDGFMKFNLASLVTAVDTNFGNHNWVVTKAVLKVTEHHNPNNAAYNRGAGHFEVRWIATDSWVEGSGRNKSPGTTGVTFNTKSNYLNAQLDAALGTFADLNADGDLQLNLALAQSFVNDIRAGGDVSFFFTATDSTLGVVFNTRSIGDGRPRPTLTITANVPANVTVTAFTVADQSTASALYTNSATVNVSITATPGSGSITGYMITESATAPAPGDTRWSATPLTQYTMAGAQGDVTLYAWAKDTAGSVGQKTAMIFYSTALPVVSNIVVTPGAAGQATVTWTTDVRAVGSVTVRPIAAGATDSTVSETALGTSHSVLITGLVAGTNYKLVITNNEKAEPAIYWPERWPIPGDVNGDCKVNILDLITVRTKLNLDPASGDNAIADVNGDGKINILDLIFVRSKLNTACP